MAKFFDHIPEDQQTFIADQKLFFIATAPSEGRINLSPKGLDTFRVLDPNTVAYLDLTGSGNETAAHLMQNGRVTLMFCSFEKKPLILRLYGSGRVVTMGDAEWDSLHAHFEPMSGTRQIIVIDVAQTQTSCGFAVPFYEFVSERSQLVDYSVKKGEDGMKAYRIKNNQASIDGLPTPPLY